MAKITAYIRKNLFIGFLILAAACLLSPTFAYAKNGATTSAALITASENLPLKKNYHVVILRKFLESYDSPLASHAGTLVAQAGNNNIDWRMVAAISGVESTFGKQIPYNSYNAWGWGIYGDKTLYFNSYDQAIKTISKSLREDYMDKWGATNIYEIGRFYAASPTWASRVDYFMNKISDFEQANPIDSLSISL